MTRSYSPFSVTQQRSPLPYARLFFPPGELRAGRPTGMIDPDPVVPPEPSTDLDLHRGRSLVLVGVMDPPGRPRTEAVELATKTPRLLKSPSLSLLTETERRNKSSILTKVNNFAVN